MDFFLIIVILAVSILGFTLMVPVSLYFVLNLDTQPSVTVGVRLFLFKHYFARSKKIHQRGITHADKQSGKNWTVRMKGASFKSLIRWLLFIVRERQTLRRTVAAFVTFVKNEIVSVDRYYIRMNLRGGLFSPDLTGQLYGLVQICKSIPNDSLSLSFHPNFMEERLRMTIVAVTVFRIYKIVNQLVLFVWHLPVMKLVKIYYNYRKESANA
jgi:hypothetical protein